MRKYKFHILAFLISFFVLAQFNFDPDLGWHLAYGERFLASGQIINQDSFSWTMPGFDWANPYFLYQIIIAELFKRIGFFYSAILFGVLASLGVLIAAKIRSLLSFLVAFLGVIIVFPNLGVKPHVFDFLLFGLLLLMLERKLYKKIKFIPVWFLFFALWANLHMGFLIGFLVFCAFVVVDFFWEKVRGIKRTVWQPALMLLSAFLGTLLTPLNFRIWKYLIFDSHVPISRIYVDEFLPAVMVFPLNLFYLLSGLIFIYIFLKNFKKIEPAWLLVGAFTFMLPFLTSFFDIFWGAMFIFIASRHLEFNIKWKGFWERLPLVFSLTIACTVLFLNFFLNAYDSYKNHSELKRYPVGAIAFMKEKGLNENLYNDYGWGGFLDWQYRQGRIFIDGRMAGWRKPDGVYILQDYIKIAQGDCNTVQRYNIKIALIKKEDNLVCFAKWNKVYEDEVAKVLVKPKN